RVRERGEGADWGTRFYNLTNRSWRGASGRNKVTLDFGLGELHTYVFINRVSRPTIAIK
ncbi:hypothetical protein ACTXT7_016428, partial [Hymenolepis weldensis]